MPPKWFNAVVAILAGSLVFLAAANLRQYQVLVILLIGIVITFQVQKSGVSPKVDNYKSILIAMIVLLPLYLLLVFTAQYFTPVLGSLLSPLLASAILATFVYILSIVERKKIN